MLHRDPVIVEDENYDALLSQPSLEDPVVIKVDECDRYSSIVCSIELEL